LFFNSGDFPDNLVLGWFVFFQDWDHGRPNPLAFDSRVKSSGSM
jgi:hypothetical protein